MDALRRLVLLVLCPAFVVAAVTMPVVEKGDWHVTGEETISGSIINALNVTVENGGFLTISGSTLQLTGASNGSSILWVREGGTLKIIENSRVTSASSNDVRYLFWADPDSVLEIRGSTITKCGVSSSADNKTGPYVQTNATIENSVFERNHNGLIISSTTATITNSKFVNNGLRGLYLTNSTNSNVQGNEIKNNGAFGVDVRDGGDNALSTNVFGYNGDDSIYVHGTSSGNVISGTIAGGLSLNASNNAVEDAYIPEGGAFVVYSDYPGQTFRNVKFADGTQLTVQAGAKAVLENIEIANSAGITLGAGGSSVLCY